MEANSGSIGAPNRFVESKANYLRAKLAARNSEVLKISGFYFIIA
jgi:hypothetical protein